MDPPTTLRPWTWAPAWAPTSPSSPPAASAAAVDDATRRAAHAALTSALCAAAGSDAVGAGARQPLQRGGTLPDALEGAVFTGAPPSRYRDDVRRLCLAIRTHARVASALARGRLRPGSLAEAVASPSVTAVPALLEALQESEEALGLGLELAGGCGGDASGSGGGGGGGGHPLRLPPGPALHVLMCLTARDVCALGGVNRAMRAAVGTSLLWHRLVERDFGEGARAAAAAADASRRAADAAVVAAAAAAAAAEEAAERRRRRKRRRMEAGTVEDGGGGRREWAWTDYGDSGSDDGSDDGAAAVTAALHSTVPPPPPLPAVPPPLRRQIGESWLSAYRRAVGEAAAAARRAAVPRVPCKLCGITAAEVRWAQRGSFHQVRYQLCGSCGGTHVLERSTGDIPVMARLHAQ